MNAALAWGLKSKNSIDAFEYKWPRALERSNILSPAWLGLTKNAAQNVPSPMYTLSTQFLNSKGVDRFRKKDSYERDNM